MSILVKQAAGKSVVGILLSLLLFFSAGIKVPLLDATAESYFRDSISKAGVSYGVCRIINATVSIIQESSLQLEPAGIGLSMAVGQVVDPINDMVERLSNVLVLAISSLGVQELTYEISLTLAPPFMACSLLVLSTLVWFRHRRIVALQGVFLGFLILITIGRFCLPLSSMANEFLQKNYFEDRIADANRELTRSIADLNQLQEIALPGGEGILETIEGGASYLKRKSLALKDAVAATVEKKELIVENLLRLTFLYIGIFAIQVLLLPLLVFWFLSRIVSPLLLTTTVTTLTTPDSGSSNQ